MQKTSPHRVLFLSSWYPNRIMPKNGNFVRRHARAVARVCEVVSLHVISDEQSRDFEVAVAEVEGVTEVIVYYPKSATWRPWKKYRMYLEAHRRGYDWIQKNWGAVDITHLNIIYPAGIFALELKKKYGIPFLLSENWTAWLPVNPYQFTMLENYFIKKIGSEISAFCPVSEDLKKAFESYGFEGPFHVVPNVVDTDTFTLGESREREEQSLDPIKILHVSTFKDGHKNISGILRVLARLQSVRTDFEVTMAGNRFGDKYQAQIDSLGISPKNLRILPVLPLKEIAKMMQEHHVFVLFSNYENLPCVVAEAHCAGMVVVGSNVGGTAEMIDEKNGLIVEARDEEKLFESLLHIMDNIKKYKPKQIRETAVRRYSYEHTGLAFEQIYTSILTKKS